MYALGEVSAWKRTSPGGKKTAPVPRSCATQGDHPHTPINGVLRLGLRGVLVGILQ
jgi:hypothetical protein